MGGPAPGAGGPPPGGKRRGAEPAAAEALAARLEAESKSQALAVKRAEAESAAADALRGRIAAEEALRRKALDAAEAARSALAAARDRAAQEQELDRAVEARKRAGPRRPWAVAAGLLGLLSIGSIYFLQPAPEPSRGGASGEPLKLRLAPELKSAKP